MRPWTLPWIAIPLLAACARGGGGGAPAPPDTAAPADSAVRAAVVLVGGPLRLEPAPGSPAVTTVAAGKALRVVGDTAIAGVRWTRLATWDDRRGWMPAAAAVDAALWNHYVRSLGGLPPTALRPAYPLEGRWIAEAPYPSPDLDVHAGRVWLIGERATETAVARRDSAALPCADARERISILTGGPGEPGSGVQPDRAVVALPAPHPPEASPVAVGPLPADSAPAGALAAALNDLRGRAGLPAGVPRVEWRRLGPTAVWAGLVWPPDGSARWAAGLLLLRGPGGWRAERVIGPRRVEGAGDRPPWRPVAALATAADGRPTVLLVVAEEPGGAHADLYLAGGTDYRRIYAGYRWGCGDRRAGEGR